MAEQHPLFEAWEKIHCCELPGNTHPNAVARRLLHDPDFPETIDRELFERCVDEVKEGGIDFYSKEIIECMAYLAALHLHGQDD